ncbi:MAG: tetratricopeptide repeat protein [Deltaproteobacteria bacterium]|nr:tetratricopeptide repeat protein [Deltaproteobacteria bacterium]
MPRVTKRRSVLPQDEVVGFFTRLWEVVKQNRKLALLGIGGLALLVLVLSLTTFLQNRRKDQARAALAQVRPLLSQADQVEEALKALERVLADYPNTPPAKEAALFRAHLLYQQKKYDQAAKAYEDLLRTLDESERQGLDLLIAESLSYCYEALGDFHRAATALAPPLEKGTGPQQGELLRRVAWLYEKAGNNKEAARYWRKLLERPPTPALVPYLKEKLAALGPEPGKDKP